MIDWTSHKFILVWVKENLDAYQFLTPEAKQIKKNMESISLETDENIKEFGKVYEEFLVLVERNPFTKKNGEGNPAEILVNDFYFYFYPTKQNILIPVGLQIEMGVTNTKEKAKEFKERLSLSVVDWNKECEETKRENMKLPDINDGDEEYDVILDNAPSSFSAMLRTVILLVMAIICLGGNGYIYAKYRTEIDNLKLIASCAVTIISSIYSFKSIQWILREKQRKAYVKAWKELKGEEEPIVKEEYRTAEMFQSILERIGTQQYQKNNVLTMTVSNEVPTDKNINLNDLVQKKVRNRLYTVNWSYIIAMIMAFMCFCVYAENIMPDSINKIKQSIAVQIDKKIVSPYLFNISEEDRMAALDSVNLDFFVLQDGAVAFADANKETPLYSYSKGSTFRFAGIEKNDSDSIMCRFVDEKNMEGYIDASLVQMKDNNEMVPSDIQLIDSTGALEDMDNIDALFDGRPDTAIKAVKGNVIRMIIPDAVKIRNLFIMNGDLKGENSGILTARIAINEDEPYWVSFSAKYNGTGYVIPLPEEKVNVLEIQICDTFDKNNEGYISEMKLCR